MSKQRSIYALLLVFLVLAGTSALGAQETPSSSLVLILDASGSMWGQIGGENKIVIARRVLGELVDDLPEDARVGLVAYGHRREGDCADIETVVPLGDLDKAALKAEVDTLQPKGKTPITASVQEAFGLLRGGAGGATVILVSDGLETCGGDPCAAVRAAKEEGISFILHVVGFDVAKEDVSSLECAAQAGGGLFLGAEDADQLSAALETAVAMPAETPAGRLVVETVADGELYDAGIHVTPRDGGESIAARTYSSPETNPRSIPLADGAYDVEVRAVGLKGDVRRGFEVEIRDGSTVEKRFDFSTGELSIGVTRNGELSDAVYKVYVAGSREEVASGRTYRSASSNPAGVRITLGSYEVELGSVEISGKPSHSFGEVEVAPGKTLELRHDFQSGTLEVGAVQGAERVDAVVRIYDAENGGAVDQSRTYTGEKTNPKTFVLSPGRYRIEARAVGLEGRPERQVEVTVAAGATVAETLDFGS